QAMVCGTDQAGNLLYCYQKPAVPVKCPEGCVCLTKAEADRLGYELCLGQAMVCGTDQAGNLKYCYQKPR
ncbi:hypothetical protein ACFLWX_03920, partial [Chloroflexota bacterium]